MNGFRRTGLSLALVAMLFQAAVAGIAAAAAADPGAGLPGASGYIEICTRHGLMRVPTEAAANSEEPAGGKLSFGCDCTMCPVLGAGLTPPSAPPALWAPGESRIDRPAPAAPDARRHRQTGPPPTRAPPFGL